jgi:hypothetical protein
MQATTVLQTQLLLQPISFAELKKALCAAQQQQAQQVQQQVRQQWRQQQQHGMHGDAGALQFLGSSSSSSSSRVPGKIKAGKDSKAADGIGGNSSNSNAAHELRMARGPRSDAAASRSSSDDKDSSSTLGNLPGDREAYAGLKLTAFKQVFGNDLAAAERALAPLAPKTLRKLLLSNGSEAASAASTVLDSDQHQPQQPPQPPQLQHHQQQQQREEEEEQEAAVVNGVAEIAGDNAAAAAEVAAEAAADTAGVGRHPTSSDKARGMQLVPTQVSVATGVSSSSSSSSALPDASCSGRAPHSQDAAVSDGTAGAAAGISIDAKEQLALGEMLCDLLDYLHSQLVLTEQHDAAASEASARVIEEGHEANSSDDEQQNQQQHVEAKGWWREQPLLNSSSGADAAVVKALQLVAAAGRRLTSELAGGLVGDVGIAGSLAHATALRCNNRITAASVGSLAYKRCATYAGVNTRCCVAAGDGHNVMLTHQS